MMCASLGMVAQSTDSLKADVNTKKRELFVDVNLTNPLLFGKFGGGVEWRSPRNSLYVYANYKYGLSNISQTVYFNKSYAAVVQKVNPNETAKISGFDVGFQIRFRDKAISKPYSQYLHNLESKSPFYSGFWIEAAYAKSDVLAVDTNGARRISSGWDIKAGPLVGWNIKVQRFCIDIYGALGFGAASFNFEDLAFGISESATVGVFRYDIGLKLGYKIR